MSRKDTFPITNTFPANNTLPAGNVPSTTTIRTTRHELIEKLKHGEEVSVVVVHGAVGEEYKKNPFVASLLGRGKNEYRTPLVTYSREYTDYDSCYVMNYTALQNLLLIICRDMAKIASSSKSKMTEPVLMPFCQKFYFTDFHYQTKTLIMVRLLLRYLTNLVVPVALPEIVTCLPFSDPANVKVYNSYGVIGRVSNQEHIDRSATFSRKSIFLETKPTKESGSVLPTTAPLVRDIEIDTLSAYVVFVEPYYFDGFGRRLQMTQWMLESILRNLVVPKDASIDVRVFETSDPSPYVEMELDSLRDIIVNQHNKIATKRAGFGSSTFFPDMSLTLLRYSVQPEQVFGKLPTDYVEYVFSRMVEMSKKKKGEITAIHPEAIYRALNVPENIKGILGNLIMNEIDGYAAAITVSLLCEEGDLITDHAQVTEPSFLYLFRSVYEYVKREGIVLKNQLSCKKYGIDNFIDATAFLRIIKTLSSILAAITAGEKVVMAHKIDDVWETVEQIKKAKFTTSAGNQNNVFIELTPTSNEKSATEIYKYKDDDYYLPSGVVATGADKATTIWCISYATQPDKRRLLTMYA